MSGLYSYAVGAAQQAAAAEVYLAVKKNQARRDVGAVGALPTGKVPKTIMVTHTDPRIFSRELELTSTL